MEESLETQSRRLAEFLQRYPRATVLSGAGCSTPSGIPDYRDEDGEWKHRRPMQYQDFIADIDNRRRYWAQSFAGWRRFSGAQPNNAHTAIASLERRGRVNAVVTQNVDNLHRIAGSQNVIDLHGVLNAVRCLNCDARFARSDIQRRLQEANPDWDIRMTQIAPDGDARVNATSFASFSIPDCTDCGGVLKPDVVFFGEPVPAARVMQAQRALDESRALLVVGSSLMVFSGYRFAREANQSGIPIAIVNRGKTRADDIADLKIRSDCSSVLARANELLAA